MSKSGFSVQGNSQYSNILSIPDNFDKKEKTLSSTNMLEKV